MLAATNSTTHLRWVVTSWAGADCYACKSSLVVIVGAEVGVAIRDLVSADSTPTSVARPAHSSLHSDQIRPFRISGGSGGGVPCPPWGGGVPPDPGAAWVPSAVAGVTTAAVRLRDHPSPPQRPRGEA